MASDLKVKKELVKQLEMLKHLELKKKRKKIYNNYYFNPKSETLNLDCYPKHKEFFENGKINKFRCFMAANRIGKTESGGLYEASLHAIGWYPSWWNGLELNQGQDLTILIVSDSYKDSRNIIQNKLLRHHETADVGTGLIPYENIVEMRSLGNVPGCLDYMKVKRDCGGFTIIYFKASSQGREAFQGVEADIIYFDEEPPEPVFTEGLIRLASKMKGLTGLMIATFTPLRGMTNLVSMMLNNPEYLVTIATWEDAPHLDEETKRKLEATIPEWQRDARTKGIPQLGAGAVYRIAIDDIKIEFFDIPADWKHFYGMDVGYNHTCIAMFAENPVTNEIYMYDELHIQGKGAVEYTPLAKMKVGSMKGAVDPAAMAKSQTDGKQVFQVIREGGLDVITADNDVESGIMKIDILLKSGKLKIFSRCEYFFKEYKTYMRDDKNYGKIVKKDDHMMDAMRYGIVSGRYVGKPLEVVKKVDKGSAARRYGFMG